MSETDRISEVPPRAGYANHGRTTAAWAMVTIVVVGAVLVGAGMFVSLAWLAWVGVGVIVLGLLTGAGLRALGHGQPLAPRASDPQATSGSAPGGSVQAS